MPGKWLGNVEKRRCRTESQSNSMKVVAESIPSKGVFGILLSRDAGRSQFDDSALQRDGDGVGPVIGSKLGEHVFEMALDGYLSQR